MEQERFDVFLTGDRNLQFQQNVTGARLAVVVLAAQSTQLVHTLPLMERVSALLPILTPGTVTTVS